MNHKIAPFLLLTASLATAAPASAIDAEVAPASTRVAVNLGGLLNLAGPGLGGVDESTPLAALIGRGGIGAALVPDFVSMTWNPVFESFATLYTSTSSQGVVRIGGRQVAVQPKTLSSSCIGPGTCALVGETLSLSGAIREAIAGEALRGLTVGDLVNGNARANPVPVEYFRQWTHGPTLTPTPDHRASFVIDVAARLNFDVRGTTRLLEVRGDAANQVLAVGTGARIPLNLRWTARVQSVGTVRPITLRSDSVEVLAPGGAVLQRLPRPLTRSIGGAARSPAAPGVRRATVVAEVFSEQVFLPPAVTRRARELGAASIVVRRTFTDGSASASGEVTVPIGSSSMAAFQLTRVDLRYTDGSRVKVLEAGGALTVIADINYLGSGQLQATWEWAPVDAGALPLFRPLPPAAPEAAAATLSDFSTRRTSTLVREFLDNRQRVTLSSPPLPTGTTGGVLVRLRITAPEVAFDLPVLRYYVTGTADGDAGIAAARRLDWIAPAAGSPLDADTVFSWRLDQAAEVYRYECYASDDLAGGIVAGGVVPGDRDRSRPTQLVLERIAAGRTYWCRVVAIDAAGQVVAVSELRALGDALE